MKLMKDALIKNMDRKIEKGNKVEIPEGEVELIFLIVPVRAGKM